MSDEFLIPPPATATVWHDHKPELYLSDGRALVRRAGFVVSGERHTQQAVRPGRASKSIARPTNARRRRC